MIDVTELDTGLDKVDEGDEGVAVPALGLGQIVVLEIEYPLGTNSDVDEVVDIIVDDEVLDAVEVVLAEVWFEA